MPEILVEVSSIGTVFVYEYQDTFFYCHKGDTYIFETLTEPTDGCRISDIEDINIVSSKDPINSLDDLIRIVKS